MAASEATLTMMPSARATMPGSTARERATAVRTFMRYRRSHTSSSVSQTGDPPANPPTPFTRTSTAPRGRRHGLGSGGLGDVGLDELEPCVREGIGLGALDLGALRRVDPGYDHAIVRGEKGGRDRAPEGAGPTAHDDVAGCAAHVTSEARRRFHCSRA